MNRARFAPIATIALLAACGQQAPGAPQSSLATTAAAAGPEAPGAPTPPAAAATNSPAGEPIARTTSPAPEEPDDCGASKLAGFVGQQANAPTKAKIATESGARTIRYIAPGDAVTMDYNPARLNVEIGEDGRIQRFRCG